MDRLIPWRALESTGEHWRALESTGEHWKALESTGKHWKALESTGKHWKALESTGEEDSTPLSQRRKWPPTVSIIRHPPGALHAGFLQPE